MIIAVPAPAEGHPSTDPIQVEYLSDVEMATARGGQAITAACAIYQYPANLGARYDLPTYTPPSNLTYYCSLAEITQLVIDNIIEPYNQQLASNVYNTLYQIESVRNHFFDYAGMYNVDLSVSCNLDEEYTCAPGANTFTFSLEYHGITWADLDGYEGSPCRDDFDCGEDFYCDYFSASYPEPFGECTDAEWWFD